MFIFSKIKNLPYLRFLKEWGIIGAIKNPWAIRRGFTKEMVEICEITVENHHEFISDREHNSRWPFNYPYNGAVSDKLGLIRILHQYRECMPEYYFFIDESGFLPLWDVPNKNSMKTREGVNAFVNLLDEKKILVIKPTHSEVGYGFMVAKRMDNGYSINNSPCSLDEMKKIISGAHNTIVTEYVIQHQYARNICPTSLNTIRMLGVWNGEKKEFEIVRSFHRFGCKGNVVDNVGSGNGILVFVDPETGILENVGLLNENHQGDKLIYDVKHPDSGIKLSGMQIPGYLEMKKKVLQILNDNSYLRYVGFDVAITDDGFRIIEANGSSTPSAAQVKGGFLKDKRMVEMFNRISPL